MSNHLRIMNNYRGVIPFLIETAKQHGMRLEEKDFLHGDIECVNNDVVIFRGGSDKIIDRLLECIKRGGSAHEMIHGGDLHVSGNQSGILEGNRRLGGKPCEIGKGRGIGHIFLANVPRQVSLAGTAGESHATGAKALGLLCSSQALCLSGGTSNWCSSKLLTASD